MHDFRSPLFLSNLEAMAITLHSHKCCLVLRVLLKQLLTCYNCSCSKLVVHAGTASCSLIYAFNILIGNHIPTAILKVLLHHQHDATQPSSYSKLGTEWAQQIG